MPLPKMAPVQARRALYPGQRWPPEGRRPSALTQDVGPASAGRRGAMGGGEGAVRGPGVALGGRPPLQEPPGSGCACF